MKTTLQRQSLPEPQAKDEREESPRRRRVALVSGASSGIGRLVARDLALRNFRVVLLVRDEARGRSAQNWIRATTESDATELLLCDLGDLEQVHRAIAVMGERHEILDLLVNNAGLISRQHRLSPQGHEWTLAVNHLGPFLLTNQLLSLLPSGARIVNLASVAHTRGRIDFDNMELSSHYSFWEAYARSKLANILFTYALARRLKERRIAVNCLHPGTLPTGIAMGYSRLVGWLWRAGAPFFKKVSEGSDGVIYLATAPQLEGVSGTYFHLKKQAESSPLSRDENLQEEFWRWSLAAIQ
jgi:NAD(P)-dependent dehydrogenase (short-subunit alcohol dehydrogenase family)